MRIVIQIQIDGAEVTVTTQPGATAEAGPQAPVASATPGRLTPAVGAQDAGPAPAGPVPSLGMAPLPFTSPGPSAPVAGPGDLSAGAAPGTAAEAPAPVEMEEDQ